MERAIDTNRDGLMDSAVPSKLERHIYLMDALIQLLRGELTNQLFENRCRQLVGTNGYMLYTVDRVVSGCVRHLQTIMNDVMATQLVVWF